MCQAFNNLELASFLFWGNFCFEFASSETRVYLCRMNLVAQKCWQLLVLLVWQEHLLLPLVVRSAVFSCPYLVVWQKLGQWHLSSIWYITISRLFVAPHLVRAMGKGLQMCAFRSRGMHTHMPPPPPTHTDLHTLKHAHMHALTNMHAHMHTCTHARTHTHTHIHIHWHSLTLSYSFSVKCLCFMQRMASNTEQCQEVTPSSAWNKADHIAKGNQSKVSGTLLCLSVKLKHCKRQ